MPQCTGMSLDEDERLRSDAELECFLTSSSASSGASRPGADYLSETKPGPCARHSGAVGGFGGLPGEAQVGRWPM
jgi:hypothetical protein